MDGSQLTMPPDESCPLDTDPLDARAECSARQLETLARLTDICMDAAEMVRELIALDLQNAREAAAGDKPRAAPVLQGDIGLMLPRIAKAVRLTMTLETKIAEGKLAAELERATARAARREADRQAPIIAHAALVDEREEKIERLIEAGVDEYCRAEGYDRDELVGDAMERLEEDEDFADCLNHPIGPIIARVFKALEITPDWSRWARQAWAMAEAEANTPGSPYAAQPNFPCETGKPPGAGPPPGPSP